MAKITQHHLVWTRREWSSSILRHNPYAKIRLSEAAHIDFHEEHEPFECLTPRVAERFERLAQKAVITCPRDVLQTMINVCEHLLAGPPVPWSDVQALRNNIRKAQEQQAWLDARVPRWNKRRTPKRAKATAGHLI